MWQSLLRNRKLRFTENLSQLWNTNESVKFFSNRPSSSCLVHLVFIVCVVEQDQLDERKNQTDQTNQIDQMNQTSAPSRVYSR